MNDRIDFLSPFRDKHPLDGRAYKDRIGRPFYGSALRKLIDPPPSRIARLHLWWERTSAEPGFWGVLLFLTAVSVIAGGLIASR
jgi:hypothetical protein